MIYTGGINLTQTNFSQYYNGSEIVVAGQILDNDVDAFIPQVVAISVRILFHYTLCEMFWKGLRYTVPLYIVMTHLCYARVKEGWRFLRRAKLWNPLKLLLNAVSRGSGLISQSSSSWINSKCDIKRSSSHYFTHHTVSVSYYYLFTCSSWDNIYNYITLLYHYISEGNISLFISLHLLNSFSYLLIGNIFFWLKIYMK